MAEPKTKISDAVVADFINSVLNEGRRKDSKVLLSIFKKVTGLKPKMWGTSIVGYGRYHYKSERSSQEGDWPLIAFSPRKQNLSLYVTFGIEDTDILLKKLGKYKKSKGCLYINKLADVNLDLLEKIIKKSYDISKKKLAGK